MLVAALNGTTAMMSLIYHVSQATISILQMVVVFLRLVSEATHIITKKATAIFVLINGVQAMTTNLHQPTLLKKSGIMIEPNHDDNVILYESQRLFAIETKFESPTIQAHSECINSTSIDNIKQAELTLAEDELTDLENEMGLGGTATQVGVRAAGYNPKSIWIDGGKSCDQANWDCEAKPLIYEIS